MWERAFFRKVPERACCDGTLSQQIKDPKGWVPNYLFLTLVSPNSCFTTSLKVPTPSHTSSLYMLTAQHPTPSSSQLCVTNLYGYVVINLHPHWLGTNYTCFTQFCNPGIVSVLTVTVRYSIHPKTPTHFITRTNENRHELPKESWVKEQQSDVSFRN